MKPHLLVVHSQRWCLVTPCVAGCPELGHVGWMLPSNISVVYYAFVETSIMSAKYKWIFINIPSCLCFPQTYIIIWWMFPKTGVPQNGWYNGSKPYWNGMIWGVFPLFWGWHPYILPQHSNLKMFVGSFEVPRLHIRWLASMKSHLDPQRIQSLRSDPTLTTWRYRNTEIARCKQKWLPEIFRYQSVHDHYQIETMPRKSNFFMIQHCRFFVLFLLVCYLLWMLCFSQSKSLRFCEKLSVQ